jgi:glycosyltransferase involved in cell wall biosynthesis
MERLRSQVGTEHLSWEIIVIDNNSQDNTAQVVCKYQTDFPYLVHYYLEMQQGAAFARRSAVKIAQSDIVGFLDDDNLPEPNWVAEAYAFAQAHPQAGAYGSRIHADCEVDPPKNFERILPFLAITQRGSKPSLYDPQRGLLPPSAGLVIRRQAWISNVPSETILSGRVEGSMLTGEDLEVLSYIQQSGWEIWYNPAMEIAHKIPYWRLEKPYLMSMLRGIGLSRHVTRMIRVQPLPLPLMTLIYMVSDARKILFHLMKHGVNVKNDPVAASEMQLFLGSFLSPIYLYKNGYLNGNNNRVKSLTKTKGNSEPNQSKPMS